MSNSKKALITIALAVLAWWLFGCGELLDEPPSPPVSIQSESAVTLSFLEDLYRTDNETYFQSKLLRNPVISLTEQRDDLMASTMCHADGACEIKFNPKYIAAQRIASEVMLHEQCHIKTWLKDLDNFGIQVEHGKVWRSCMLQLDQAGAFREIIIDNYHEAN